MAPFHVDFQCIMVKKFQTTMTFKLFKRSKHSPLCMADIIPITLMVPFFEFFDFVYLLLLQEQMEADEGACPDDVQQAL